MGYLLLTGSTGLLGSYLINDFLQRGQHLALIVRGNRVQSARERVERIMQRWDQLHQTSLPRPVVLEGDIQKERLGLSSSDIDWIRKNCDAILHNAASLKFFEDDSGEPWLSNIVGVQNVIDVCKLTGIHDFHHVSTAYVCGLREGVVLESELDRNQSFRNDYEKSKLIAEQMVRNESFFDSVTVYRPAVIAGDSKTGYTTTYHGIYLYLRMMALIVPRQPVDSSGRRKTVLRVPMKGAERRNVVTVDWVSTVISHLYGVPKARGLTFHLAPDFGLTPRQLIEAGYSYFQSSGIRWVGYQDIDPSTYSPLEAELLPAMKLYDSYERTDPTFDKTNLKKFAGNIKCPEIDEAMIHRFIGYAEEDRWGKRRITNGHPKLFLSEILEQIPAWSQSSSAAASRLSLDILGPGGGQWTLYALNDRSVACHRGIDSRADVVLKIGVEEFLDKIGVADPSDLGDVQESVNNMIGRLISKS